ncbi:histidine kinase N-terminal 7TM domain-containing diguanylate cyclase [Paenibacillus sacheonensis]|uniref:Diguanylate cyclase n=1 Tax=Paenibacillus sacheonensis TaxID=742054 RepID=A0A7X5C127_9BACL|nr:GGDEF domain-containing protein [Paenibacillus sacheonensis]MBM7567363.1 diguanylate cyclase (GGDEF)-like protein [Paenibacillus sacheonensis]NBC69855.1 diguanylate cyclase [Paenibacillus sacheonensis]
MTGIDLGLLASLFAIFIYVFIKHVISAQYKVYLFFHFFMMIWPVGQIGVHTTEQPHLQIAYITLSFVGLSMLGFGWLLFAKFLVSGSYYKPNRSTVLLLLAPSILLSAAMIWNPSHAFVAPVHGSYEERVYGPVFWSMILLLITYFVYSVQLLWRKARLLSDRTDKARLVNALAGIIIVFALPVVDLTVNVILDPWLPVIPGITSFGILLSDIFFLTSLQKHRSFDLVRIAQQDVVDTLSVGIIVLDEHDVVIEVNRNVCPKLGIALWKPINLTAILSAHALQPEAGEAFLLEFRGHASKRLHTELAIELPNEPKQYLSLHTAPILIGGSLKGRVITLQDITELKSHVLKSQEQNNSLQERNRALIYMQDELFQANRKLEQMAVTDSLTGCFNRRFLMQQLEHEVQTNLRYRIPFAILLFDIDLFKHVNDNYGHLVGDEVIKRTAEAVRGALRRTDILARYGGEEFTVYLPHTSKEQAEMLAQRIREVVESNEIPAGRGRAPISVTISMGMHVVEEQTDIQIADVKSYLRDLFTKIDTALYRAKHNGRNRVVNH